MGGGGGCVFDTCIFYLYFVSKLTCTFSRMYTCVCVCGGGGGVSSGELDVSVL